MLASKSSSTVFKNMMMAQTQMRFFGVLPKLPRVELTMRTPYRTFFENFNNFTRIYVHTNKGLIAIGNRSIPRIYLLPPGELTVKNIQAGKYTQPTPCFPPSTAKLDWETANNQYLSFVVKLMLIEL